MRYMQRQLQLLSLDDIASLQSAKNTMTIWPDARAIRQTNHDDRADRVVDRSCLQHRPLVLLDIETTGGNPRQSRITEIGALRLENGAIVKTMNQLVNPQQSIPSFITSLTGITDSLVRPAPPFVDVADDLEQLLDGAIFVAHCVQFDYGFIKQEFARLGRPFQADRVCSVRLSRRLHPEALSHGLDAIIDRLGISVEHRHRAFDDAEVLYSMFIQEYNTNSVELFRGIQKLLISTRQPVRYQQRKLIGN